MDEKIKRNCKTCGKETPNKLCDSCLKKELKAKAKLKREKAILKSKERRAKKKELITVKKLDTIFSKLIRQIYPEICHGCGIQISRKESQSAHFIGRGRYSTRWDPRNCLPACKYCNFYDQSHVYSLGNWINKYHGENIAEDLRLKGKETIKISQEAKNNLFIVFNNYYKIALENSISIEQLIKDYEECLF